MKIVVLDGYTLNPGDNPWDVVEANGDLTIYDRTPPEQIYQRARDADIIVGNKAVLDRDLIRRLDKLKFITVMATGYNVVDIDAARQKGIPVSNVPVYGTDSVAQYVFAALLNLIHKIAEHDQSVRAGEWTACKDFSYWKTTIFELAGKTMGIVGLGRIGLATSRLAQAFGMRVVAYSRSPTGSHDDSDIERMDLDSLFAQADVVSLHVPQTPETEGFVNQTRLGKMKPTAILINTARGGLVNEQDLADALNSGQIAGACIDVVSTEPIAADNPLLGARNCQITPHIAWAAIEARRRLMQTTADNIAAFMAGHPINVVN
jgi:glycerate dehydrogenase